MSHCVPEIPGVKSTRELRTVVYGVLRRIYRLLVMTDAVTSLAALVVALRRRKADMELEHSTAEPAPKSVLDLPESSYGQYYASLIHQQNMLQVRGSHVSRGPRTGSR